MHSYDDNNGFIRLEGDDIINGVIDINSATAMLSGTQETIQYFLKKENSDYAQYRNLNFPVKTREGSWEIVVPFLGTISITPEMALGCAVGLGASLVVRPLEAGLSEYAKTIGKAKAAKRLAAKDDKASFEDAFKKLESVIKIAQHLGTITNKRTLDIKLNKDSKTALLTNANGNIMSITMDEVRIFQECPDKLLRRLCTVITDYRTLHIGYKINDTIYEVSIDRESKEIFTPDEDAEIPVLPELQNGQYVKLTGFVTRGNQQTNTIGFKYDEHIITSEPNNKLITSYINAHYKTCEISGYIVRTTLADITNGKRDRPKIIFDDLVPVETVTSQTSLL